MNGNGARVEAGIATNPSLLASYQFLGHPRSIAVSKVAEHVYRKLRVIHARLIRQHTIYSGVDTRSYLRDLGFTAGFYQLFYRKQVESLYQVITA